jgi:hypothetical protein
MDCGLLVAGQDHPDGVLASAQGIDQRQIAVAGDADGEGDAFSDQHFDDDFRTVQVQRHSRNSQK